MLKLVWLKAAAIATRNKKNYRLAELHQNKAVTAFLIVETVRSISSLLNKILLA
jgi:hypothetical protein